jgi:hypothetical protein
MAQDRSEKAAATREKIAQGKQIVRGKLARWCFRWTLTGLLAAMLLPRYPSWIWVLYVLVPLGVLNLFLLLRVYVQLYALGALADVSEEAQRDE